MKIITWAKKKPKTIPNLITPKFHDEKKDLGFPENVELLRFFFVNSDDKKFK